MAPRWVRPLFLATVAALILFAAAHWYQGGRTAQPSTINIAANAVAVGAFTLSLAITPGTVHGGEPVTFAGTLTKSGPTAVSGAVVTVTPYSTDGTCTNPVPWGSWTATTDAGGNYKTDPIPTDAPAGDYYYKASSHGVMSGCEHFTIA